MELTMAEKVEFLDCIRDLLLNNVLNKDDRNEIYLVCLAACGRELAKAQKDGGRDEI